MFKTLLASAALLALLPAHAINVGSTGFTYSENFDSLTTTASTTVAWANDSTLPGWSLFNSLNAAITTYGADTGSSNAGSFRSYGAAAATDRALGDLASGGAYFGAPASGAAAGYIAVSFTNATAGALGGFTIGYSGEQWRNGGNTAAQSLVLEYGYGATFGAVTTWTAPGAAFNFTSTQNTATAAAVDGNTIGLVSGLGGSVASSWAAGSTLWVRWTDLNDVGNDHGLAIDNLSFSVTPVPEPESYALLAAGLAAVAFVVRRRKA